MKFLQRCNRGFWSSGMWGYVTG